MTHKDRLVGLQNQFSQQYSKIGNTREQLFHTWRSFHFNEDTETPDSYVTCIGQVATLLGYGKPQTLEVFKNTCPIRLYWVLFPIEYLRQAVETARRILTKKTIDRQLEGQSFSTPFMNIKDGYVSKKVTFEAVGSLEDKISRLTPLMTKLTTQDDGQDIQFKPKIHQGKRKVQTRNFHERGNYDQRIYPISTYQIAEAGKLNLVIELSVDKIIKIGVR